MLLVMNLWIIKKNNNNLILRNSEDGSDGK